MSEMMDKMIEAVEEAEEIRLPEEEERFRIENDQAADWAMRKIREIKQEFLDWNDFYVKQIERVEKATTFRCQHLQRLLEEYFRTVPHKATKTQESYQLPSGKLVLKRQGPEFERDDEQLLPWLKENIPALVKVKESPDWANLKKHLTIVGDKAVDPDGEIVPGITVTERPDEFRVEVK